MAAAVVVVRMVVAEVVVVVVFGLTNSRVHWPLALDLVPLALELVPLALELVLVVVLAIVQVPSIRTRSSTSCTENPTHALPRSSWYCTST